MAESWEQLRARYDALRERDRTIASMQSKQRMRPVFAVLFSEARRAEIDDMLREALAQLRRDATTLAVQLARRAFVELGDHDLREMGEGLERVEAHLEQASGEALDVCFDLLTFCDERAAIQGPLRIRPRPDDEG